jgi:hypothetical protein
MSASTNLLSASPTRGLGRNSHRVVRFAAAAGTAAALISLSQPARAVDGCLVLLCLAAPSWSAIAQCVPPVTQVLRDLARGRPFPTCGMAGAGNSARLQWANAPSNCPAQYTSEVQMVNGTVYGCAYAGVVTVDIEGSPWSRTWWSMGGNSVTEFSPTAKARMGNWNTQFDDDHAAWQASLPPPPPPCLTC